MQVLEHNAQFFPSHFSRVLALGLTMLKEILHLLSLAQDLRVGSVMSPTWMTKEHTEADNVYRRSVCFVVILIEGI